MAHIPFDGSLLALWICVKQFEYSYDVKVFYIMLYLVTFFSEILKNM